MDISGLAKLWYFYRWLLTLLAWCQLNNAPFGLSLPKAMNPFTPNQWREIAEKRK